MQTMCEESVWTQHHSQLVSQPQRPLQRQPTATWCNSQVGKFSSGEYQGSEENALSITEPIFPPSYCRNNAKKITLVLQFFSFQGILWIWNFISLVSIHHILSVKFQLLSVRRLGKYAKIYPNAVNIALHAISGPTTGSWKNEGWEVLSTIKILLASAR